MKELKVLTILAGVIVMNACQWFTGEKEEVAERMPSDVATDAAAEIAEELGKDGGPLAGLVIVRGYPVARAVPGKDGHVFNPYTKNEVDVRGLPRHLLVRDPKDLDPNHAFRTP